MAAGSYIIAMTGPGDTEKGMERLVNALREIDRNLKERSKGSVSEPDPELQELEQVYTNWETEAERECGWKTAILKWEETEGKIAVESAYLYPPGIPLIVPGERISAGIIRQILVYEEMGFTIEGTRTEGKMEVMIDGQDILSHGEEFIGKRYTL